MVLLWFCPICCSVRMGTRGVGKTNANLCLTICQERGLDAIDDSIFVLFGGCGHLYLLPVDCEVRLDDTVIEFQFLANVAQVVEVKRLPVLVFEGQSYDAQVQPMWIRTKILGGFFVTTVFGAFVFHGIDLRMAVPQVHCSLTLSGCQFQSVGEGVPPPVAHGGQGNTVFIVFCE